MDHVTPGRPAISSSQFSVPQVEELDRRNQILMRNISSLFKTAQEEGRRKDAIIKELRMQQWQSAAQKPSQ